MFVGTDKKVYMKDREKSLLIVLAMVVASYFLWNTILLYPLKLFVVILHELSHGLAAMLFGGKILEISIDHRIGGFCQYAAPHNFIGSIITASAGYLGSIFWGCLIFYLGVKTKFDKVIIMVIAVIVFLMTILYVRELFGFIFCMLFSIAMGISALKLPHKFNDLLVKFLGTASCLYAVVDIKDDLITRTVTGSDSYAIAEMLKMPFLSVPIGILWILISIGALVFTAFLAFKSDGENSRTVALED